MRGGVCARRHDVTARFRQLRRARAIAAMCRRLVLPIRDQLPASFCWLTFRLLQLAALVAAGCCQLVLVRQQLPTGFRRLALPHLCQLAALVASGSRRLVLSIFYQLPASLVQLPTRLRQLPALVVALAFGHSRRATRSTGHGQVAWHGQPWQGVHDGARGGRRTRRVPREHRVDNRIEVAVCHKVAEAGAAAADAAGRHHAHPTLTQEVFVLV
mmetsp:Transcript_35777/g.105769  ORF Transcript_35777/g.105769 Transcript_35777/m.105769 type:complete len:214 (+) Transcript_35777:1246-1887(+)